MAAATVSRLLRQLISIAAAEAREEVRLVVGVDREVEMLSSNFTAIQVVLDDAERREVKEQSVRLWLDQLKDTSYDMEDVLDEWITARLKLQIEGVPDNHESALTHVPQKKVCSFLSASCFCFNARFVLRRDIAFKIKELNERVDYIAKETYMFNFSVTRSLKPPERRETTSLVDISEVYGRESEKYELISMLLSESGENEEGPHIISIVGMGGIGKTTLAQMAYNSYEVINHFEIRMWVCVSEPFDELRIAKSIARALGGGITNLGEFQSLLQHISKSIVGKKFFLVLDDVWTEDYFKWEPFSRCLKNGLHGSKILITTRKETVAYMMRSTDIIALKEFSADASWSLFCQIAFFGRSPSEREHLEVIGRRIVLKCKGLPLAIKTVGSLLCSKITSNEWEMILHSEIWELEEYGKMLLAPLLLSYNDLPSNVKSCFSYCAIFPKDFQINKDKLIKLWMAQGYLGMEESKEMEIRGEQYFDLLVKRSFFQDFEEDDNGNILTCKMHDIVHDFSQFLAKNESLTMEVNDGLQAKNTSYDYKLRHIMLALNKGVSFPVSMCGAKRVRSLLIQYGVTNCPSISEVLPIIFIELTYLRALDLSGQFLFEKVIARIPEGIERLILLRYLNLSSLKIEELPEKLCELCNLQTLELSWCTNLRKLPEGMGKLIRLRHLVNVETSLSYIPRGIESLTGLRTLSEFVVSGDSKACTLAWLKNLNHLQGSLSVKNLGSVTDFSVVNEANLQNKRKIICLYLNFENDAEEVRMNGDDKSKMSAGERDLEALQLPPNLEFLEIRGYKGNARFLDCIMSLSMLRTLNLHGCTNLDHWPPLGELSSLESLSISSMRSVRVVNKLLGIRSIGASSSSSVTVFPRLKSLKFVNMEEWEDWEDWDCGTIMPSLRFLSLVYCPKLKALPGRILQTRMLEELTINWCTVLEERCNERGEDWHIISQIPNIMINFEFVKRGRP